MALINCPQCGEKISDRAASCPHCNLNIPQESLILCEDCTREYAGNLAACPSCGCPNFTILRKNKKRKRKRKIIFSILIIIMILITLGCRVLKAGLEIEYYANMAAAYNTMIDGATQAENAGNLITRVWNNSIYNKRNDETDKYTMENGKFLNDFNDALANLFADETFIENISAIRKNYSEATGLMKKLKNPPAKYNEEYSMLKTCYDNYLKMTKSVINPTGSLNSFSENFNTYDSDMIDSIEKMNLYLD